MVMIPVTVRRVAALLFLIVLLVRISVAFAAGEDQLRLKIVTPRDTELAIKIADAMERRLQAPVSIIPEGNTYAVTGCVFGSRGNLIEQAQQIYRLHAESIVTVRLVSGGGQTGLSGVFPASYYSVTAAKIAHSIRIDGKLNIDEWRDAALIQGLVQFDPLDRMPESETTRIYICYDDEAIYFGVHCLDNNPDKIVAFETRRDARLSGDDHIMIKLDTFHDRRNHFIFLTNPLSSMRDGIFTNNRDNNWDWNGVWYTQSSRTPDGWTVEMKIPFRTLRFKPGQNVSWGFNIGRYLRRNKEVAFWAPLPRKLLNFHGFYRADYFGTLEGLNLSGQGQRFGLKPYLLGGNSRNYVSDTKLNSREFGGDLRYAFSANNKLELSYNMDFAQVEADREIVNLSRFPIRFPEKRDFFLETQGLFDVSPSVAYTLFYSRRIGLSRGRPVPIRGAAKYSGKFGPVSAGFLHAATERTALTDDGGDTIHLPETQYTAFRLQQDVGEKSYAGLMLLNKQEPDRYNRVAEADGNLFLMENLRFRWSVARSFTKDQPDKDDWGYFSLLDYLKGDYNMSFRYFDMGNNYKPEMGYLREVRYRSYFNAHEYIFWLNNRVVRSLESHVSGFLVYNRNNTLRHDWYWTQQSLELQSGDEIFFQYQYRHDWLKGDLNILDLTIPKGKYDVGGYAVGLDLNPSRRISGEVGLRQFNYYGGERDEVAVEGSVRPFRWLKVDVDYEWNRVILPGQRLTANTLSNRWSFSLTPKLYLRSFIQWNDVDAELSGQFLFHYQYRPDSDLYLVINQTRDPEYIWDLQKNRSVFVKWTYLLQI